MIYFITLSVVSFFIAVVLLVAIGGFIVWVKRDIGDDK